MKINRLLLGSTSPYRQTLLKSTGLPFDVAAADVDEQAIVANNPRDLALARAKAKGLAVARLNPGTLVIGADQVLGFEGQSFDKAADAGEAALRLRQFSGQTHFLHSAFCLAFRGSDWEDAVLVHGDVVDVPMSMRRLTDEEIAAYVATGEWRGVVGCYQFENKGVHLFVQVGGDSSAIIGLPLPQLLQALRTCGVNPLLQPLPPWPLYLA